MSARQTLWEQLRAASLVEGEIPDAADARAPWYVRAVLGIAGWIGALFLLGFVGAMLAGIVEHEVLMLVIGAGLCGSAVLLCRLQVRNDFVAQFGLALSLAGQALMVGGLAQLFERSVFALALGVAAQQAALFLILPDYAHRVWTAATACVAMMVALHTTPLQPFIPALVGAGFAWLALAEFQLARRGAMVRAGSWGLALATAYVAITHGEVGFDTFYSSASRALPRSTAIAWAGRLACAAVLVAAAAALLKREGLALAAAPARLAIAGAAIVGLSSLSAPGIGMAVLVVIVGYANGNRLLAGFGIVTLLAALTHYYYALHVTLLHKAGLLALIGSALLGARLVLARLGPQPGER